MSAVVRQELFFFFSCILTGTALLWCYEVLLLFRKAVRHSALAVNAEDLLYWCGTAFAVFAVIFCANSGIIRGYAFVGILTGVWLQVWLQKKIRMFLEKIFTKLLKKSRKKDKMTHEKGNGS